MARSRYIRILPHLVALVGVVLFSVTAHLFAQTRDGADSPGCRQVSMGPSYARIRAFDDSHTKFASKYSLYLYREQFQDPLPGSSKDDSDKDAEFLNGIPALFIPGNAGSYRQVRSIAAKASDLYFGADQGVRNYDFFAAEFNEDFTAFHGRTMLDQGEYLNDAIKYILFLYSDKPNPPKSVLLLGHSMGGIVARVMLTLPNYVEDSVQTIVTLALPHAAAPLTTDGDILRIYSAIDRFWYAGLHHEDHDAPSISSQRLQNVALISITGGLLDNTLPADYTTLGFLVPETHGITVYTTGIKNVWTPVDHLAIVWCSQLRTQILHMLLDFADDSVPSKQKPLEERMRIARRRLLSGFEAVCEQDNVPHTLLDRVFELQVAKSQIEFVGKESKAQELNSFVKAYDLDLKLDFTLIGSHINTWKKFMELRTHTAVLLCKNHQAETHGDVYVLGDKPTETDVHFDCVDAEPDAHDIPNTRAHVLEDTSDGGDMPPLRTIRYNSKEVNQYKYVIVVGGETDEFAIARVEANLNIEVNSTLADLLLGTTVVELPPNRPLISNVKVSGAWSSILAYRLSIHGNTGDKTPFLPVVRQWKSDPYETKWHLHPQGSLLLTVHGVAPFTPFKFESKNADQGLNLELWSVSNQSEPLKFTLTVDLVQSLRLLVLRYRLAIIAFTVATVLLVFAVQMSTLAATKSCPSFSYSLSELAAPKAFGLLCLILAALTPIVRISLVQKALDMLDPVVLQDKNEINLSLHAEFKLNSYFLGLEEACLWFVGPFFYVIAIGLVWLTHWIIYAGAMSLSYVVKKFQLEQKTAEKDIKSESTSVDRHKLVIFLVVCVITSIYVPYQLAYVVCCFTEAAVVVRLYCSGNRSLVNYHTTVFLLMVWVLPINIPVLIVFVHNLTVDWTTPFSSHHNFLALLPIMLVVGRHSSGNYLPKLDKGSVGLKVVYGYVGYFVLYSIIYGIRHTFWLHHLMNLLFSLIFIIEEQIQET